MQPNRQRWRRAVSAMHIVRAFLLFLLTSTALDVDAQSDRRPAFEAASVKANRAGAASSGAQLQPGGRFIANNSTLFNLVRNAYTFDGEPLQTAQIIGPDWIKTARFDIVATAGREVTLREAQAMLVTLLEDRFALAAHRERRVMPLYELRVVRDAQRGPSLKPSFVDCAQRAAEARTQNAANLLPQCGTRSGNGTLLGTGITIPRFASSLANFVVGQVIVDRTFLTGTYDIELRWGDAPGTAAGTSTDASIFTALQEQLGLKLESTRGEADVLVVDRAEMPREN